MSRRKLTIPVVEESGYGAFPGGDPREFFPDVDGNTDEELAAHRAACDAWSLAEKEGRILPNEEPAHIWATLGERGICHLARAMYGLGVYTFKEPNPFHESWAPRLWSPLIERGLRPRNYPRFPRKLKKRLKAVGALP